MKFTITPLGGAGRGVTKIVEAVVRYLQPRPQDIGQAAGDTGDGATGYYADSGEEPGRWLGSGAEALGLEGEVQREDFSRFLAGRDPHTGERLITAQGSAGRRPKLGVGNATRVGPGGERLYDTRDAAGVLDLPQSQVKRMLDIGTAVALSGLLPGSITREPDASYLVPVVDAAGNRWVTDAELTRCEDAIQAGTTAEAVAATGQPGDLLPLAEAARLAGVTPRYLRRLAQRYKQDHPAITRTLDRGGEPRQAYLPASKDERGHWQVTRRDLAEFLTRRRPPAVRVGYDLTLTTEKSLAVLALLGSDPIRATVLDAIQVGNDRALGWLERNAAATRVKGKVVRVDGWAVASFRHLTSRALDPFPHHHNVVGNTAADRHGVRRALDARQLYLNIKAASALATAEMRYQLTTRLGVRWRPGRNGGWEIAGIDDNILREFSRRRTEIEDALRELEEALGHGAHPDAVGHIALATRPAKLHARVQDLLDDWWQRATAHGLTPDDLPALTTLPPPAEVPNDEDLFARLAAPDGICRNLSVFHRGDVLAALANLALPQPDDQDDQPLIVTADELNRLADAFLDSDHVIQIAAGGDDAPTRYSTREMLALQSRIVARYRTGLGTDHARVPHAILDRVLDQASTLSDEQRDLVRAFCASGHAIQTAIGRAGTGKTTAMATAAHAWQAAGLRVLGTAVKGEAARILNATTGIPTETLAWYLAHPDPLAAPLDARTILVVDEASTISDRDLDHLAWMAHETGASLRLIGDPAQHSAVEAGGMFRVLCERHPRHTPELTITRRLTDPHDRAAADALRDGDIATALEYLAEAGHLHLVEDDLQIYIDMLTRWWHAHQTGQHHPMVNRDNRIRRQLNRLAHVLLRAHGHLGTATIAASEGRHFAIGDRVIARTPNRQLTTGTRDHYIRNGATGTITALHHGTDPQDDHLTVDFDGIGPIDIPRTFFDHHHITPDHHDAGIDHAYAVTSYAVQGATHSTSTSRIDPTSTRAETYVDITRGITANHLYITRPNDPLDGEHLPRTPPNPLLEDIETQLTTSIGERTAWEIHHAAVEERVKPGPGRVRGL